MQSMKERTGWNMDEGEAGWNRDGGEAGSGCDKEGKEGKNVV
jgi:hypothetical protein